MLRRVLLLALFAALLAAPAAAHTPHDVIEAWAMSPDFPKDHTLFVSLPRFNLLLRSTDGGESWASCQRGLVSVFVTQIAVSPDFARDHTLWCVEIKGLFVSHDAGETWTQVNLPKGLQEITSLAVSPLFAQDGVLAAGTRRAGLWISNTRGTEFERVQIDGAPKEALAVTALSFDRDRLRSPGDELMALLGEKHVLIWVGGASQDDAADRPEFPGSAFASKIPATEGAELTDPQCLVSCEDIYVGSRTGGVFRTPDTGVYSPCGELPKGANVLQLSSAHDADGTRVLFASTADHGVQIRRGDGPWTASLDGFREPTHQTKLHWMGTMVSPAWATDHTVYACCFEGLFVSTDGGSKWRWLNTLHPQLVRNLALSPHFAQDGTLWLSTYGAGLLRSDDRGHTLSATSSGDWSFPDGIAVSPDWKREASAPEAPLAPATGSVLVGTPNLLLLSHDGGATAASCLPSAKGFPRYVAFAPDWPTSGTAFAFLVADTGRLKDNLLLRSTDGGAHWAPTDLASAYDLAFAPDWGRSGHAWAAGADGVFRTLDRGQSFTRLESAPAAAINSLALAPGGEPDGPPCLAAVARGGGIFLSRDGGETWQHLAGPPPLPGFVELSPGFAHDGLIFAGTSTDGVWLSHDAGATWSRTPGGPRDVLAMELSPSFAQDHTLLVGSYEGPWITEDAGASWRAIVITVPEGYVPDPSRESATGSPIPPAPRK